MVNSAKSRGPHSLGLSGIDQQITFLHTNDLLATRRFYEEVMGLDLVLDQGDCRVYRTAGDAYLGFCERTSDSSTLGRLILTLVTEDVDAWYEYLCGQAVDLERAPSHSAEYGIYHCFFRDPNGYSIEIQRFDDAQWFEAGTDSKGQDSGATL
jgi:catechol 2,3-dioxygenase-like lactoylglutathione lyase family enzyme